LWPDARKAAGDLDGEARATFSDDKALAPAVQRP
jgi:hypothetical protein